MVFFGFSCKPDLLAACDKVILFPLVILEAGILHGQNLPMRKMQEAMENLFECLQINDWLEWWHGALVGSPVTAELEVQLRRAGLPFWVFSVFSSFLRSPETCMCRSIRDSQWPLDMYERLNGVYVCVWVGVKKTRSMMDGWMNGKQPVL